MGNDTIQGQQDCLDSDERRRYLCGVHGSNSAAGLIMPPDPEVGQFALHWASSLLQHCASGTLSPRKKWTGTLSAIRRESDRGGGLVIIELLDSRSTLQQSGG